MPEAKLERYLRRLNLEDNTPIDKTEKLIQNMVKHGYLLRAREDAGGEMVTEYHLGPRAKVEIGKEGVLNMLNTVSTRFSISNIKRLILIVMCRSTVFKLPRGWKKR